MGRKRVISDELVGWTGTEKALPSPPLPSPAPSMFAPFCPMLSLDSLIAHASPVSP